MLRLKPKKIVWKHTNMGCDLYKSWAYKRNYIAEIFDADGDRYTYTIYETSAAEERRMELRMESSFFQYDIFERCEKLMRSFNKGYCDRKLLNETELELLNKDEGKGKIVFNPENVIVIPYSKMGNAIG